MSKSGSKKYKSNEENDAYLFHYLVRAVQVKIKVRNQGGLAAALIY